MQRKMLEYFDNSSSLCRNGYLRGGLNFIADKK